jgi:hypothetical protein
VCTGFWWVSLRERDLWGVPDVDGRIILRRIFKKIIQYIGQHIELTVYLNVKHIRTVTFFRGIFVS